MFNAIAKRVKTFNMSTPAAGVLGWAEEISRNTPDYHWLLEYEFQLLFVYNNMMMGHRDSRAIEESVYMANAFTRATYKMFKKDLGPHSYPVALAKEGKITEKWGELEGPGPIRGELYLIRPQQFLVLDKELDNTVAFERRRVNLNVPSRKVIYAHEKNKIEEVTGVQFNGTPRITVQSEMASVRAWMYVGNPDYWKDLVADEFYGYSGPDYLMKTTKLYKPNNPKLLPYYYFSKQELDVKQSNAG